MVVLVHCQGQSRAWLLSCLPSLQRSVLLSAQPPWSTGVVSEAHLPFSCSNLNKRNGNLRSTRSTSFHFHCLNPKTLSSNNSRSETPNPDKSHIFGIVRTSAFSWCYPYRVYDIRMLSNCGKYQKIHFFAFLGVRSQKNSTGRRSDNIDASGLPNSSSES